MATVVPEGGEPVPDNKKKQYSPTAVSPSPTHRVKRPKWVVHLDKFMNTAGMQLAIGLLLLLSLFLPDAWVAGNAANRDDDILYSVLTVVLVVFWVELVLLSIVSEGYFLGFFFWMDLVGTLSIILDIAWMSDPFLPRSSQNQTGGANASIFRAARAARLGARYGRLMRLLKLMKFFNRWTERSDEDQGTQPEASAIKTVSASLSAVLARRVAALVLILVIVVPFLQYSWSDHSVDTWLTSFHLLDQGNANATTIDEFVGEFRDFYRDMDIQPMRLTGPDGFVVEWERANRVRSDNEVIYKVQGWKAKMDFTTVARADAMFGILLIVLVIVALFGFSASFHNAVDALVVAPLDRMLKALRHSATSLLGAVQALDEESGDGSEDDDDEQLETELLEAMVAKLTRIMGHVLPGAQQQYMQSNDVDESTAQWLQTEYAAAGRAPARMNSRTRAFTSQPSGSRFMALKRRVSSSGDNLVQKDDLCSWEFNVLHYQQEELSGVMKSLFRTTSLLDEFNISNDVLSAFLGQVEKRYKDNPYHNFFHACDVCHTTFRIIDVSKLSEALSQLELLSLLVAALAHDVGHPAVTNAYLVKTRNALAITHNDRSPLENMHCAVLYEIVRNQESNVFANLTDEQWRDSRKLIISAILGTDMVHHFAQISKLQVLLEVHGDELKALSTGKATEAACLSASENRDLITDVVLHAADISNPVRPFDICETWAKLVVQEFFAQGDKEKDAGMEISPMMDRDTTNMFTMQLNFLEFVVFPLYHTIAELFPALEQLEQNLATNFGCWGDRRCTELRNETDVPEGSTVSAEITKVEERVRKFRAKALRPP